MCATVLVRIADPMAAYSSEEWQLVRELQLVPAD
jgi:hypothetical protein